jgi:hypothetical protein
LNSFGFDPVKCSEASLIGIFFGKKDKNYLRLSLSFRKLISRFLFLVGVQLDPAPDEFFRRVLDFKSGLLFMCDLGLTWWLLMCILGLTWFLGLLTRGDRGSLLSKFF